MYNTVDQPQDPSTERADSSSAAMASFVQELYSSASMELAKVARSFADSFTLNDLEIEDATTNDTDREGKGADLERTTVPSGSADPVPTPGTTPNIEASGKPVDGKDGSDFSRKTVPNGEADPIPKEGSDPNARASGKAANSKDGAAKDNGGLDKGNLDIQKDLIPGIVNDADAKLNKEGKSTPKPFSKQDLLKEFEKGGGVNTLGPRTEEANSPDKDKGSKPNSSNPQHSK